MVHVEWTGKSIKNIQLYCKRTHPFYFGFNFGIENIPFIILYCICLYHCLLTIGEPYTNALKQIKKNDNIHTNKLNSDNLAFEALSSGIKNNVPEPNDSFNIPDDITLPNPYLPGLLPFLCLTLSGLLHILMLLFQIWSISFLCLIKYCPVDSLDKTTYIKIIPRTFKGKTMIVPLKKSTYNDRFIYYFIFQKHKYIAEIIDNNKIIFRKVKPPITNNLQLYLQSKGIQNEKIYKSLIELYGLNEFSIPQPIFIDLYKDQLLEPLTVFQIFSVLLWIMDEYWQYPLFTLAMIFLFEGVTVLSRLKNLKTLRGMNNDKKNIYVYRYYKWITCSTHEVVPSDIISLKIDNRNKNNVEKDNTLNTKENNNNVNDNDNTVPCDGLIIRGTAVVNESTLTGESIPQMKEALSIENQNDNLNDKLNIKLDHKVHILFGGTTIMQHHNDSGFINKLNDIPNPPDNGIILYVLRTGFCASQGKLVRMIEYSTDKNSSNNNNGRFISDAMGLALLLLLFALISSTYVLLQGLKKNNGVFTFHLLIRCVLIITSVVPAELPMQTSLAINSALLSLVRMAIFCTEPYRIALAGKISICLFDKTGTITTDQLTAVGVISNENDDKNDNVDKKLTTYNVDGNIKLKKMNEGGKSVTLILSSCHSLVEIDGKLKGDPVEEANLRAVGYSYDPVKKRAYPNKDNTYTYNVESVEIITRYHFKSKLQRMSVIGKVIFNDSNTAIGIKGYTVYKSLVKGSPEAVESLLAKDERPPWYHKVYNEMARSGMRVLGLAYKDLPKYDSDNCSREYAESNLKFAGFACYQCLVRRDSKDIIKALKNSDHLVTMITGDATLTAIHVAKQVGIIKQQNENKVHSDEKNLEENKIDNTLILNISENNDKGNKLAWVSSITNKETYKFNALEIPTLAKSNNLCISGKVLDTFVYDEKSNDMIWSNLDHIRVFSRMTPELKERVIIALKKKGHFALMCGDGGNDVGALKQAHIGVALLSGFGSANVDRLNGEINNTKDHLMKQHTSVLRKKLKSLDGANVDVTRIHILKKEELVDLLLKKQNKDTLSNKAASKNKNKTSSLTKPLNTLNAEDKKQLLMKKQQELEKEIKRRELNGESFARMKALIEFAKRESQLAKENAKKNNNFSNATTNLTINKYLEDFEDGEALPMVKLGDASIASSFTTRQPSIAACVDIIRQGRCALVTTIQMYQILAINCLISSYSLAVLTLDKVKYGNNQMIGLGIMSTISSLTLSRASPLSELSTVRPLNTIFHPALFLSLFGQFFLHLYCMIYAIHLAKEYTPDTTSNSNNISLSSSSNITPNKNDFVPNILSTVVFLVNAVQNVSVCFVNYKGRPFMKGMADNPGLLYSLGISLIAVTLSATEIMPLFNKLLQIVPLPNYTFAKTLSSILFFDVFGAFMIDQLCLFIFARKTFYAAIESTSKDDFKKFIKMGIITLLFIYFISSIDYDEIQRQQKLMANMNDIPSKVEGIKY